MLYRISPEPGIKGMSIIAANVQVYVCPVTRTARQYAARCITYVRLSAVLCVCSSGTRYVEGHGTQMISVDPIEKQARCLVKCRGKQKIQFPPFLSAVPVIYTTRHALPYLKHKTIMLPMRPHFCESLDTYRWATIAQSVYRLATGWTV
jgi:hypothetical protein